MIVLFLRLLIFIAIIFLLYTAYKYVMNPVRKLEIAKDKKQFYFLDDTDNIKKNLLITYKGIVFEGEKYLGTTDKAFEVVNIIVRSHNPNNLKGLDREDLYFLEEEILIHYPHAKIEWKYPLNKLIVQQM